MGKHKIVNNPVTRLFLAENFDHITDTQGLRDYNPMIRHLKIALVNKTKRDAQNISFYICVTTALTQKCLILRVYDITKPYIFIRAVYA